MTVAELMDEMRLAAEGKPLTGRWQKDHMPERRQWLGGVSNNLPRMAEACLASIRPEEAAAWWLELLEEEWGERGFWDAQEPGSRTYGGATWASELTALAVFRRTLPGHPVIAALERSLTRRAAWYALTGVPAVTRVGARDQVIYLGMGSLTTGGRSNHFENHEADQVMHRVLVGARPPTEKQATELTRLLDSLMRIGGEGWSGVAESTCEKLRELVEKEGAEVGSVRAATALLGPARTLAPLTVRRYADGTLACYVEWNPSSNTSCAFLVASKTPARPLSLRDQVAFVHPYGEHLRVRDTGKKGSLGDRILGRGETWFEGDTFFAANLTPAEELRKGGPRFVMDHDLPPASTVLWELRLSPDAPPRIGGGSAVPPPPPGPKPPPPEPPAPKPKPPEPPIQPGDGSLDIPPKGLHIEVPLGKRVAVMRLLPGDGRNGRYEFLRWHAK